MLSFIAFAAAGGALRYMHNQLLPRYIGTLTANTLACACAGFAVHYGLWGLLVAAGTLSTWSTLAKELGALRRRAPALLLAHLALGTLAAQAGLMV